MVPYNGNSKPIDIRFVKESLKKEGYITEEILTKHNWSKHLLIELEEDSEVIMFGFFRFSEDLPYLEMKRFYDDFSEEEINEALKVNNKKITVFQRRDGSIAFHYSFYSDIYQDNFIENFNTALEELKQYVSAVDSRIPADNLGFRSNSHSPLRQKQWFTFEVIDNSIKHWEINI